MALAFLAPGLRSAGPAGPSGCAGPPARKPAAALAPAQGLVHGLSLLLVARSVACRARKGRKGGKSTPIPSSDSAAPDAYDQETRDIILSLDHVDKKSQDGSFILKDVSLGMYMGAKIGILGKNGAGKSTVMRILAGKDDAFQGNLHMDPDIKIGYLPQEPVLEEETVIETLRPALDHISAMVREFEEVTGQMADPDADMDLLVAKMEQLQSKIDAVNGAGAATGNSMQKCGPEAVQPSASQKNLRTYPN